MKKVNAILPHHENVSRAQSTLAQFKEKPSFAKLVDSLALKGWHPSAAPIGGQIRENANAEIHALASEYEAIETVHTYVDDDNKVIVTGEQVADYIRANYITRKGEEECETHALVAVSGTRRAYALPVAQVVRAELKKTAIVPAVVELDDSASNSLASNLVTVAGLEKVTPRDSARWVLDYAEEKPAFAEKDLVEVGLSRGRAQQLHRAYLVHKKFPKLELLNRVASGSIPLPHKETLKKWLDIKIPAKKGAKAEVEEQISNTLGTKDAQRSNRADKRELENASQCASADIVRYVIDCVNRNAINELLKATDPLAEKLNEIFQLPDSDSEEEES